MTQNAQSKDRFENYIPVAERIEQFYVKFSKGRITTTILEHDRESGFILIRAEAFRDPDDASPAATGHAFESRAEGYVNKTSYIENCETGAVGRALAMLGFEVKRGIASREEMQKVDRMSSTSSAAKPSTPDASEAAPPAPDVESLKAQVREACIALGYDEQKQNDALKRLAGRNKEQIEMALRALKQQRHDREVTQQRAYIQKGFQDQQWDDADMARHLKEKYGGRALNELSLDELIAMSDDLFTEKKPVTKGAGR
ncbi:MAG: hypothetical protein ACR2LC_09465 [Pyrinomonadaceae bacterium]